MHFDDWLFYYYHLFDSYYDYLIFFKGAKQTTHLSNQVFTIVLIITASIMIELYLPFHAKNDFYYNIKLVNDYADFKLTKIRYLSCFILDQLVSN